MSNVIEPNIRPFSDVTNSFVTMGIFLRVCKFFFMYKSLAKFLIN